MSKLSSSLDSDWRFNALTKFYQILLYSLYYAETCIECAGPISASLRPGNTASFEEMSQRWRAVGNTVPDLTGLRYVSPASETNALPFD